MTNRKLAPELLAVLLVMAGAACSLSRGTDPSRLIELNSQTLVGLKDEFNRASGGARIIVMLSPT